MNLKNIKGSNLSLSADEEKRRKAVVGNNETQLAMQGITQLDKDCIIGSV